MVTIDINSSLDNLTNDIEKSNWSAAQDQLKKGYSTSYENEEGLFVEEFPDGKIFHIDLDMKTGETIYLERLK